MFPLYSNRPVERFPLVTVFLIVVNIWAFWFQISGEGSLSVSVMRYGMIPADLFHWGATGIEGRLPAFQTLFRSMFMHGGFLHLGANMLYLWVFGRTVEDDFGRLRFLAFYLFCGVFATAAFAVAFPSGAVPLVGASGAIAGILGAYFLRFPLSRIHTMFFFIIVVKVIAVPAILFLGLWFAIQIGSCFIHYTAAEGVSGQGGVAWISHVAGFVAGMVWTIFELRRRYLLRG